MVAMRDEGLIGAVGLSNVTAEEYETAKAITEVACIQNAYNLADRSDQALVDACAADGVAYVPFFPLGSAFRPDKPVLTAPAVVATANRLGATTAQVALAWLLQQAPNLLLIPGTSSLGGRATGRLRPSGGSRGTITERLWGSWPVRTLTASS
jgi:pyridoxine 4-dehydrogenase